MEQKDNLYKVLKLPCGSVTLLDTEDYKEQKDSPWFKSEQGYVRGRITNSEGVRGSQVMLHRVLLEAPEGVFVDHINGDRLDNRRTNLRLCTNQDNNRNRKPTRGSSKYKGAWFIENIGKWRSGITVDGKQTFLGYFMTEEEAALAYNKAAIKHFGEFAWLNVI